MKVRCLRIYNMMENKYEESSSLITIGKEYLVLEINICAGHWIDYRLLDDQESHRSAIYNAYDFQITSSLIPSSWKIIQRNGMLSFRPASWIEPGFWESFYDSNLQAIKIYRRELIFMLQEEGMLPKNHVDNEDEVFKDYNTPQFVYLSDYFDLDKLNQKS